MQLHDDGLEADHGRDYSRASKGKQGHAFGLRELLAHKTLGGSFLPFRVVAPQLMEYLNLQKVLSSYG